eukprot:2047160-Pleurochrysis_carterae.AAC.1
MQGGVLRISQTCKMLSLARASPARCGSCWRSGCRGRAPARRTRSRKSYKYACCGRCGGRHDETTIWNS